MVLEESWCNCFYRGELMGPDERIFSRNVLVERLIATGIPELWEYALMDQIGINALFGRVVALRKLNRSEEALAAYDEVVARFGRVEEPAIKDLVAEATSRKRGTAPR